jgi:transcriptional regulator with XRE-family HTH domain
VSLLSKINLVKKLRESRRFRDSYVYEHVRNGIPFQIRAMRKDLNWSQSELADAAKTSRTVITRIEDPNYGKLTLKTLFAIASAFNVALLVKFVPFSRLIREYEDVSSVALSAKSVTDAEEIAQLEAWANRSSNYRVAVATTPSALRVVIGTPTGITQKEPTGELGRKPFIAPFESTIAVSLKREDDAWQKMTINQ